MIFLYLLLDAQQQFTLNDVKSSSIGCLFHECIFYGGFIVCFLRGLSTCLNCDHLIFAPFATLRVESPLSDDWGLYYCYRSRF